MPEQQIDERLEKVVTFRLSELERQKLEAAAGSERNVSAYIRRRLRDAWTPQLQAATSDRQP